MSSNREALAQEWMDLIDSSITDVTRTMAEDAYQLLDEYDDNGEVVPLSATDTTTIESLRIVIQDWIMNHDGNWITVFLYRTGYIGQMSEEEYIRDHTPTPK